MEGRDELLDQFLLEGRELVAAAGEALAASALGGAGAESLDSLFRSLHTLKGSAALFELPALTAMLHAAESVLEVSRRERRLDAQDRAEVIGALDLTEAWLDALEEGAEPPARLTEDTDAARARLTRRTDEPSPSSPGPPPDWARALARASGFQAAGVAVLYRPASDAYFRGDDPLALARALPGLVALRLALVEPPDASAVYDPFRCVLELTALSSAPLAEVRSALRLVADQVELASVTAEQRLASPAETAATLRSLRVDAQRLDELAALTDELVIAKNRLLHEHGQSHGLGRAASAAALERVVADLHAEVMGLRLAPLGPLFRRFPRQVREMASALGKDVELVVAGEDVSLDKSAVEGLFTPLLHLVRNALDHGVEPPAAREAAGKPARARLTLTAQSLGEAVEVVVADDGRGIDVGRVRKKAESLGLVPAAELAALSDEAAAELVFAPGFSTAGAVSDLSGRGVGLDAVRAAVVQLGGRVGLENRTGQGLSVRLTLPARVVLTKVLVVTAGGERFGAPLGAVHETHLVEAGEISAVRAGRAYVRRERVIPLLRLADLLGLDSAGPSASFPVLAIDAGGERVGVQVEAVNERIEAPLRPLSGLLRGFPGALGAVLQGDGQVLLVLDLAELAQREATR